MPGVRNSAPQCSAAAVQLAPGELPPSAGAFSVSSPCVLLEARLVSIPALGLFLSASCGGEVEPLGDARRSYEAFRSLAEVAELEFHVDPGPAQRRAAGLARLLESSKAFRTFVLEDGDESVARRGVTEVEDQ